MSTNLKIFILAVLSFFAGFHSISQTIIPRFENFGVNEGLPHSSVYSILQDKKGYMWFGTADGLCRYDGSIFISFKYKNRDEDGVTRNIVKGKILEDRNGNIWYSNESGIYKWDVLKEVIIRVKAFNKKSYNNSEFQCIFLDETDCIWLFNLTHGIFEFNTTNGRINQYPLSNKTSLSGFALNFIDVDHNGNIWFRNGSSSDPYIVFNKKSRKYAIRFISEPPHAIFFDKKERILAYDDKLIFENADGKPTRLVPKRINGKNTPYYSYDGIRDNYNRLWMTARGKGLICYDEKEKHFHEFHHDNSKNNSLPFNLTTCLYIDRNENLWIGTDGGGVAKLDLKQPRFNLFPLSNGDYPLLNDYFTKCFFVDEQGRIWFGSQTNGLNIYDPETYKLINLKHENGNINSLPGNIVGSILKDKDGNMWIGSSGGISLFNEKDKSFKTIQIENLPKLYPLINNFVNKLIQLRKGDILAATTLGIIKIRKEQKGGYKGYFFGNRHLTSLTTDITEMPDNMIYATLGSLGLYQFEPDGEGFKYRDTFLAGIDLLSLRADEKATGYLWISSTIGLIHFNTLTHAYRIYDEEDGLANSHVYGSLEDLEGNFWVSTNKGLSSFNKQKSSFDNYSYQDGLQSNEFNSQAFYKSKSGVFYFGGVNGFNWFDPGFTGRKQRNPTAAVTRIEINEILFQKDTDYIINHTITVPYDQNDFNFQFASLDYTRPVANKIMYMLQGWDAGWISSGNRFTRYANLPPGKYTLRLKVSNTSGLWSDEENISIIIKAPFWKQRWFIIVITLLLLSIIIYITYRFAQQKAKSKMQLLEKQIAIDAERYRISADMHDEIGSGISHIALLSELIQAQKKGGMELKKDILTIATSARRLVQAMSEIIWALSPQNDTLENLLAYTREQSQKYFEPFDIKFNIDFPDEVPVIKLSNEQRRNLYLVTREALNNALKHSDASTIYLRLEITDNDFCFSVTDNGNGMNEKMSRPGSNGLSNMKKRMEEIGGTIVWLMPENGTTVKYCLPL
jgi:signal transduction histidine kinase/ligand-binding sensor domain-containing protein